MTDDAGFPVGRGERHATWVTMLGAVAGAAAIYFFSTERGRQWLRELPDAGRDWARSVREALTLVREIAEEVEKSIGTFEQALGRVGQSVSAREGAAAVPRNGGERAIAP